MALYPPWLSSNPVNATRETNMEGEMSLATISSGGREWEGVRGGGERVGEDVGDMMRRLEGLGLEKGGGRGEGSQIQGGEMSRQDGKRRGLCEENDESLVLDEAGEDLMKVWKEMYGLDENLPPEKVVPPLNWGRTKHTYPFAPHLQDCQMLHKEWSAQEQRGANGEDPQWLPSSPISGPRPPWVEGADADNLAGTRYMQSAIWRHQFPPDCSDPSLKFVVAPWPGRQFHGLCSLIHVMVQMLADAMATGRILVPIDSFDRAETEECKGDQHGSFDCYFFPIVDPKCRAVAMKLWEAGDKQHEKEYSWSDARWVCELPHRVVKARPQKSKKFNTYVPEELEDVWNSDPSSLELFGRILPKDDDPTKEFDANSSWNVRTTFEELSPEALELWWLKASWWRAQGTRFLMRRWQPNICHAANKIRHLSFGRQLAAKLAHWPERIMPRGAQDDDFLKDEKPLFRKFKVGENSLDASPLWRTDHPFLPRPIISLHVRQGDKWNEMRILSFAAHMWAAERIRRKDPTVTNIWLSTISKDVEGPVANHTEKYADWRFYFSDVVDRAQGKIEIKHWEAEVGIGRATIMGFVDLMIASECDYFIGALGSNWARVLNELRLTSGKLRAGFFAVNNDEW
eukprot:TRINITY_DN4922_c0_g2_i3.p1 TRINITY_DN4922_c0_g2~~TRINITY_DN4922_c0_g2_i3.p1  ORF type:complete len:628 (-),score=73.73 TRINITY_DN4922_c0_g2_i3:35-1918(-)